MINYKYLRAKKAEYLMSRKNAAFPKINVGYQEHHNSTVLPLRVQGCEGLLFGKGGVIDCQGQYIESSGILSRFWGSYPVKEIEYRDETVVYCGLLVKHWGHFLVESVSRLWYFLENDDGAVKYIFVIEENAKNQIEGNYLRFFQMLGISDRVEIINKPVCFRSVIVPELGYARMKYYSDPYKSIFEAIASKAIEADPTIDKAKKIYFSRGHFRKAISSEIGNDFLEHYFESNGFKILYPEELTLEEMICYIRFADICAVPSGTLPHNFLFAQDNKKIIIVERMPMINEIQVDVDRMKDLDVTYIDGHWLIYPGFAGSGPFCYGYTDEFSRFSIDYGYQHPSGYFLSEKYKKFCLKRFLKLHNRFFGYDWGMERWSIIYAEALLESHEDTVHAFFDYIKGNKPFLFHHYFQISYIKKKIKHLVKKAR